MPRWIFVLQITICSLVAYAAQYDFQRTGLFFSWWLFTCVAFKFIPILVFTKMVSWIKSKSGPIVWRGKFNFSRVVSTSVWVLFGEVSYGVQMLDKVIVLMYSHMELIFAISRAGRFNSSKSVHQTNILYTCKNRKPKFGNVNAASDLA